MSYALYPEDETDAQWHRLTALITVDQLLETDRSPKGINCNAYIILRVVDQFSLPVSTENNWYSPAVSD